MQSWAIVVIVAIVFGVLGDVLKRWASRQAGSNTELSELRERIAALEANQKKADVIARLNALEAIVTDNRFEVRRQIDALEKNGNGQ